MTMRAAVSRDVSTGKDPHGQPVPPDFQPLEVIPCRAWSRTSRHITDDGKEAIVEDLRAIVPAGADVRDDDRLVITDRSGEVVFRGPLAVRTVTRRGGPKSSPGHLELMLTRHTQGMVI